MQYKTVDQLVVGDTFLTLHHGMTHAETVVGWRVQSGRLPIGPVLVRTTATPYYLGMVGDNPPTPRVHVMARSRIVPVLEPADLHAPTACEADADHQVANDLCGLDDEFDRLRAKDELAYFYGKDC